MIEITIKRNKNSKIEYFVFSGHAGFSKKGNDIVCSAVSVLLSTLITGVVKVCKAKCNILEDNKNNNIKIELSSEYNEKVEVIVETVYCSLIEIQKRYSNWILVKEVDHGKTWKRS